jgi:hypothetical protein
VNYSRSLSANFLLRGSLAGIPDEVVCLRKVSPGQRSNRRALEAERYYGISEGFLLSGFRRLPVKLGRVHEPDPVNGGLNAIWNLRRWFVAVDYKVTLLNF